MRRNRFGTRLPAWATTTAVAVGAVAWNNAVLPGLGLSARGRVVANAVGALGLTAVWRSRGASRSELGLGRWRPGGRVGGLAGAVPLAGLAVAVAVPALRTRFLAGGRPRQAGGSAAQAAEWVLLQIPLGTVLAEELVFRAVLLSATARHLGWWKAALVHAATFGLWHARGARANGESVVGTVLTTAASTLAFDALRRRTGSVLAPALLHLALNAGGADAMLAANPARRPRP